MSFALRKVGQVIKGKFRKRYAVLVGHGIGRRHRGRDR